MANSGALTRGLPCSMLSAKGKTGACDIQKTLGIILAVVIGASVFLITLVLVLQVVLSLVGAE